jgi:hypothetical protein
MGLYWDFSSCKPEEGYEIVREHVRGLEVDISQMEKHEILFCVDDLICYIAKQMNRQGVWYSDDELSLLARSLYDWADNGVPETLKEMN